VARQLARLIQRLLVRRGLGPEADASEVDPVLEHQPLLAVLYAASVAGRVATGRRAGRRTLRVGDRIDAEAIATLAGERCASVSGVSLHLSRDTISSALPRWTPKTGHVWTSENRP